MTTSRIEARSVKGIGGLERAKLYVRQRRALTNAREIAGRDKGRNVAWPKLRAAGWMFTEQ